MFLMPRDAVLVLGRIPTHEQAKDMLREVDVMLVPYREFRLWSAHLKQHEPGSISRHQIAFISHRWLSPHPEGQPHAHVDDADNSKLKHLKAVLEHRPDVLWIWMDFWSCPQGDPALQASCINSIAYYIHSCGHFMALAHHREELNDSDRYSLANYFAGGWPRFEMLVASYRGCSSNNGMLVADARASVFTEGPDAMTPNIQKLELSSHRPERESFFSEVDFERIQPMMNLILEQQEHSAGIEGALCEVK